MNAKTLKHLKFVKIYGLYNDDIFLKSFVYFANGIVVEILDNDENWSVCVNSMKVSNNHSWSNWSKWKDIERYERAKYETANEVMSLLKKVQKRKNCLTEEQIVKLLISVDEKFDGRLRAVVGGINENISASAIAHACAIFLTFHNKWLDKNISLPENIILGLQTAYRQVTVIDPDLG